MRVVVVDPSRLILKCVSQLLAARNHDARVFVDGRGALEYIKSDPDVGVLITSAEPMSIRGIELCAETRQLTSGRRPIHIIFMSSNHDQKTLIEALDGGADEFIGKPPAAEELYARLRCAERFAAMQSELIRLATTDPLTGVLNRRAFFERAQEACAGAAAGSLLSGIMFDVDHFKRINDEYGHDVGDEALRGITRAAVERHAVVGRLGGEEFAILLAGVSLTGAVEAAERLRADMAALQFETEKGTMTLTCSFGVSEMQTGDTIDRLLKRADIALYEAKHAGRNRVVAARLELSDAGHGNRNSVIRGVARPRAAAGA